MPFNNIEIPYISSLTANELGASTQFNDDTPITELENSLNVISFFQTGQSAPGKDILDDPSVPGRDPREITEAQGMDPDNVPNSLNQIFGKKGGTTITGAISSGISEILFGETTKDYAKRIGLVILAAAIILLVLYRMK